MSDYLSTVAIVLRAQDYKEVDQLLTVYTKDRGKITVLVKGVKKNSSKLRGGVQLFGQSHLTLAVGKGIPVVINAESMDIFPTIRADFGRMSYAGYCAELIDRLLVSDEYAERVFLLILQAMNLLAYIDPWVAAKALEIRLLALLGYRAQVTACLHCGRALAGREPRKGIIGGVCHAACAAPDEQAASVPLDAEAVTVYQALGQMPAHDLGRVYVSKAARRQLEDYLDLQLSHILDAPLKTRAFLRSMLGA